MNIYLYINIFLSMMNTSKHLCLPSYISICLQFTCSAAHIYIYTHTRTQKHINICISTIQITQSQNQVAQVHTSIEQEMLRNPKTGSCFHASILKRWNARLQVVVLPLHCIALHYVTFHYSALGWTRFDLIQKGYITFGYIWVH